MFVAVVVLCLFCVTKGDLVQYKCREPGDGKARDVTEFTPVVSVPGRYKLTMCTAANVSFWQIDLYYIEGKCRRVRPKLHSVVKEAILNPTKCDNVCYSVDFDVIFSACYQVSSEFRGGKKPLRLEEMYSIQNNLSLDTYRHSQPKVIDTRTDNGVLLRWILNTPVPAYTILIKRKKNNTDDYEDYLTPAPASCSVRNISQLWCDLLLPPGHYDAHLHLEPPWYPVLNSQTFVTYNFSLYVPAPPRVETAGGGWAWWVVGGALAGGAALLLALAARHALRTRDYHKRVMAAWRDARESESSVVATEDPNEYNILLLYAREGELGQRAVDALKELLKQHVKGQVLDLYSAQVTSLCAAAPGAWVRGALLSARTKVLLLQSPAMLHLYSTDVKEQSLHLRAPLLGGAALYRAPHVGDQLLALALRLAAESAPLHSHYHKYYIATYEGLGGEILPQVVPYRRYVLPRAAPALLRDLSPSPSPVECGPVEQYVSAVDEFLTYVHDNPHYLNDELVTV